jgi:transglutaminase-like putative cysteine protease
MAVSRMDAPLPTDGGDGEQVKPHQRLLRSKGFIPTVVVVALGAFVLASPRLGGSPPRLDSITPTRGRPESTMILSGRNFGGQQETSEVRIAGIASTASEVKEWTDTRIMLTIPPDVQSGLVYVVTRNGRSDGLLFTNQDDIPQPVLAPVTAGDPYIGNYNDNPIQPSAARVGDTITIYGMNFGLEKGQSEVYFTPSGQPAASGGASSEDTLLPARDDSFDYISWSDREIKVRVPDGAASGNIMVRSDKGWSNGRYFVVNRGAGTKTYTEPRKYSVQYGISVAVATVSGENALSLWLPRILPMPEQRSVSKLGEDPPSVLDTSAASLYTFTNLQKGGRYRVSLSWMFDRYAVATQVTPSDIPPYAVDSELYRVYTGADGIADPGNTDVARAASSAIGAEKNPWLKARRIYDWLLAQLSPGPSLGDAVATLRARRGDAKGYAALYCALLRAAGIPSRVVAGYLVGEPPQQTLRHFWDELYIESLGWVPVDPFLADDPTQAPVSQDGDIDPRAYYFGNLDNRHIALTKGVAVMNQINPAGTTRTHSDLPYLLSVYEETVGALTSYTTSFEDLTVTGTY